MPPAVPGILRAAPVASQGWHTARSQERCKVLSQCSPLPRAMMTRSPTFPFSSQESKGSWKRVQVKGGRSASSLCCAASLGAPRPGG